jgi:hypothetical protein
LKSEGEQLRSLFSVPFSSRTATFAERISAVPDVGTFPHCPRVYLNEYEDMQRSGFFVCYSLVSAKPVFHIRYKTPYTAAMTPVARKVQG